MVPALSSIVKLFSEPGDSIMIQTPVYSEFYDVTEAWGRNVLENRLVEKDGAWGIDFEDFEAKAKEARIFLLCSPHNPLGIVWSREELTRMADICMANNTLLVSDEIHSDLVFHGKKTYSNSHIVRGDSRKSNQLYFRHKDLQPGRSSGIHHNFPQSGDEEEI